MNTGSMLETLLRQRIIMLEDSLARISSTRKELRDNVDHVKSDVRTCFGHHLSRLRLREQQILEKLDTVASAKDGILSQQQDQLHQALGACAQGLQWLQIAFDDVKTNKISSMDVIEHRIEDILNKFSSLDIVPRETAHVLFEGDNSALRRTIGSFGQIKLSTVTRNCESLPCGLEDYEDGNFSHALSHKTVHGPTKPINTIVVSRPKLSNDAKDWLLKEALTCRAAVNETPRQNVDSCDCQFSKGRQNQIHNWLHQIKNLVENEPAVFENFEISRKSSTNETEAVKDVLFQNYFEKVLLSPDNQWLFGKRPLEAAPVFLNANGATIFENCDDTASCNSSFTVNSFSFVNTNSCHGAKETEQSLFNHYADYWNKFLESLWASSDSLWLLPCGSSEEPVMICPSDEEDDDENEVEIQMEAVDDDDKKSPFQEFTFSATKASVFPPSDASFLVKPPVPANTLPKNMANQVVPPHQTPPGQNADLLYAPFSGLKMEPSLVAKSDVEQWLFRPPTATKIIDEPSNRASEDSLMIEEKIGWKVVLEKVHGLGDEKWLRRPQPTKMALSSAAGDEMKSSLGYQQPPILQTTT